VENIELFPDVPIVPAVLLGLFGVPVPPPPPTVTV
jgi:hypothetical protein